jgi:hypothetical protein
MDVSSLNYYCTDGGCDSGSTSYMPAWNFAPVDKLLSEAPTGDQKILNQDVPPPLFYCSDGSWSSSTDPCNIGATDGNNVGGLLDQTYQQVASYYASEVAYFETGVLTSGSGSSVSYTANTVTDTSQSFGGYNSGDCITANVSDSHGFQDWETGTVASVGGTNDDTITLSSDWSQSESWDTSSGSGSSATLPGYPQSGEAYNVASCTPPGGLGSPQDATPWPVPPSVGKKVAIEILNEPDLERYLWNAPPTIPAPTPTLTGVNVTGGTLTAGDTYYYEMASSDASADLSLPSSAVSITLPAGDNAVQISWSSVTNEAQPAYAYVVYGRTSGNELGLAAVGMDASGCPLSCAWVDKGTITPSEAPSTTDYSDYGNLFNPGVYTAMWNVVAPAMRAVDPTVQIIGPAESLPQEGYTNDWVDVNCVTSNGIGNGNATDTGRPSANTTGGACANGDHGWWQGTDYIPTLLAHANPLPSAITFHSYGNDGNNFSSQSEDNFFSGALPEYQIANYNATDKAAVDAANIPVWIDEANVTAADTSGTNNDDYRIATQMGSAWFAYNEIEWSEDDPLIQNITQFTADGGTTAFMLFGAGNESGNTSCFPQTSCQNVEQNQPVLQYWTIAEINQLLGAGGKFVNVSNVPSGFQALAVQTNPTTVIVLLANTQQTANGATTGLGASATADIQLAGATVTDAQAITINASTNNTNGPTTIDLGAESNININASGYEVDLLKFTL